MRKFTVFLRVFDWHGSLVWCYIKREERREGQYHRDQPQPLPAGWSSHHDHSPHYQPSSHTSLNISSSDPAPQFSARGSYRGPCRLGLVREKVKYFLHHYLQGSTPRQRVRLQSQELSDSEAVSEGPLQATGNSTLWDLLLPLPRVRVYPEIWTLQEILQTTQHLLKHNIKNVFQNIIVCSCMPTSTWYLIKAFANLIREFLAAAIEMQC